jgi:NAD(P)-dependent dehydrogenase (short-subunit alcohol dehydrogenase family)
MSNSSGPVVLVTGAGRGLGTGLAVKLAEAGWTVALHCHRSRTGAQAAARKISARGGRAEVFPGDLRREKDCRHVAVQVKKAFGRLDALVNNSGVYHSRSLSALTEEQWRDGIETTASAVFFLTRAVLPLLRKSKRGRVVNIGDSSCDRPTARDLAMSYHIGKTGVLMLTRSFARAEARHGVTVNMVSPGWLENSQDLPEPADLPMGRWGTVEDIWHGVEFFLREDTGYVSGSNLLVSGGWNLR